MSMKSVIAPVFVYQDVVCRHPIKQVLLTYSAACVKVNLLPILTLTLNTHRINHLILGDITGYPVYLGETDPYEPYH